jgi:hypothetical protein
MREGKKDQLRHGLDDGKVLERRPGSSLIPKTAVSLFLIESCKETYKILGLNAFSVVINN